MPFSMLEFMELVRSKDTIFKSFNRFKESSLQPVIDLLGGEYDERKGHDFRTVSPVVRRKIQAALLRLTKAKEDKYRAAIVYLETELPLIPFVNRGTERERHENCALCSVAALLGITTTDVAAGHPETEDFFAVKAARLQIERGTWRSRRNTTWWPISSTEFATC